MNRPHLGPAVLTVLLIAATLAVGELVARQVESRYIHALAPLEFGQKQQGRALQTEAFRQPDLLPLYGSSELILYQSSYRASELFRHYPTGFAVFPVGGEGATPLIFLQELAGVGADLRAKRLAVSLLPSPIVFGKADHPGYYAGNFSRLHAGELAFSTDLSFGLKQAVARRMLEFPETLEADPLLKLALEKLADGSSLSQAEYSAILPLGKLRNLVLRLQDHWETLTFIRQQAGPDAAAPRRPAKLDWPSLLARAKREAERQADSNPFGFDNRIWDHFREKWSELKNTRTDGAFLRGVQHGSGWTDAELLLQTLQELAARPLILSAPLKGVFFDYMGVSHHARLAYYRKLHELAGRFGVPLREFADYDDDPYFVIDYRSHLSPKGWAYYDQALDAFYHGTLE